ncbi:MAG: DNA-binding response regulator [Rickettsiales bacterium]|nr:DNA-binding response regulator [Rickettsiales bacterium]
MDLNFKNSQHILCIDDDDKIRNLISKFLIKNLYLVSSAKNVDCANNLLKFFTFDLIILDIMMPKINGITFLKEFRKKNTNIPILMLSALSNIEKKVSTYQFGCDDYLVKPFEPAELILRIKKLLNPRINLRTSKKISFGDFEFDFNLQELRKNNNPIRITNKEAMIIEQLAKNMNKTISRNEIAKNLKINEDSRNVDVFITRLRRKIINSDGSSFLKTIRGYGYMLKTDYEIKD